MSLSAQQARVLAALRSRGARGITQVDFLLPDVIDRLAPITRVPARIKELKDAGYSIHYAGTRDKCRVYRLLESYYAPSDGCWEWNGTRDPQGYGRIGDHYAHRVVYAREVGPIPAGRDLDHLCRNRACVRPDHLEPVEHFVNVQRGDVARLSADDAAAIRASGESTEVLAERYGVHRTTIWRARAGGGWGGEVTKGPANADKTRCPAGHEYTPENTYTNGAGGRACRTCREERDRARYIRDAQDHPVQIPAPAREDSLFVPPPRLAIFDEDAA